MISLFFIGILLLTILWNRYYARHWSRGLTVSLNFLQDHVYANNQTQMREQIENRKKLMLPVLEVAFHVDRNLSFHDCENTSVSDYIYKRDIFALLGNQRITRTLTLDCPKRGFYRIERSDLTTFSILHRRRFSLDVPAGTSLYVYAARTDVSDILVVCERLMGNLQCAKRLYEDPFAFSSIREYTITDPMKAINWKASARTGDLMVNTFESTLTEKVMIYLDIEDSGILKYENLTEESISVAASLAQKLIGRGMEVGIFVNVNTIEASDSEPPQMISLDSACSKKQLTDIEQMLAKRRADEMIVPLTTAFDIVSSEPPEDAVMILISKNAALNREAIERFVGRERQAVWVIPQTRNETYDVHTQNNIHVIIREVDPS